MPDDIRSRLFGEGPSPRQRSQVVKVFEFLQAFNNRDLKTLRGCFAEKHIDRTFFGSEPIDRDAKMRMFAGLFDTFPDWTETVDELVPNERNQVAIRHTGRGTQQKPFLGREITGRQLACTYIDLVTFDDHDHIVEYKTGQNPFHLFFDETIVGAEHIMERRAEQGGSTIGRAARHQIDMALRDGVIDNHELLLAKAAAAPMRRCEALLETSLRRCLNEAKHDSLFCEIHQLHGWGPTNIAELLR
jgi:predicted ester cyclase